MGIREVMTEYRKRHSQPLGPNLGTAPTAASVPIGGVFKHYPIDYPKVVHLLRDKGLNIKRAAQGMGVDPRNLSLICKGAIQRPRQETVEKISAFLGIEPADLYRSGN